MLGSILGSAAGGIGSALVGGLLGGAGGESGPQQVTTVNDLPDWLKPFYTGGGDYQVPQQPPINQDAVHWNTMQAMGYPMGPPPPLYANDPRYTGENIYSAPFNFMQPMDNIALNPLAALGQMNAGPQVGPMAGAGGMGPDLSYPSQNMPQQPMAPPQVPPVAPQEAQDGLSDLDRYIMRQHQQGVNQQWAADPEASTLGVPALNRQMMGNMSQPGQEYVQGLLGQPGGMQTWLDEYQQAVRRR